jgi:putative inorganic carbon (HCO3(-)) transporter
VRDLLIVLLMFGSVPLMIMRPHVGTLFWAWISYMAPHRLTWGIAYSFPFGMLTGGATILGMLIGRGDRRMVWTPTTVFWALFISWTCVSTVFALVPDEAMPAWQRSMKIQAMILCTLLLFHDRQKIEQLVWVIVGSLGFYGVKGGIFTILTGAEYRVMGPPDTFIQDNNEMALAGLMFIPLALYLYRTQKRKLVKLALLGSMGLTTIAVLGSYSRGALVALGAMSMVLVLKSKQRVPLLVAMVVVAGLAFPLMPDKWTDRMNSISSYQQDESSMGRINAWMFAVNIAKAHPFVGGGFDTFTKELFIDYAPDPAAFHDAHSIYFEVLGEQGFVGLFLYLTLAVLIFLDGGWIIRRSRGHPDLEWAMHLASMLQTSLIAFAAGGAFLGLAYFDLPYHLMAMMVLTKDIVKRQLANLPATTAPATHDAPRALLPAAPPGSQT